MSATVKQISAKPFAEYTDQEIQTFRSPTVEEHLRRIREALALTVMLNAGFAQADDLALQAELQQDAAQAVSKLCEAAWNGAHALSEALPARTMNLSVVSANDARAERS